MKTNLERKTLIVDFDSTFVKVEALDELAKIALKDKEGKEETIKEIEETTSLGMEGKISFPESLERRLDLFKINEGQIDELVEFLKSSISDSFLASKNFIKENSGSIWIISGGFEDYIFPVVSVFGIKKEHILANKFVLGVNGEVLGFDKGRFLAQDDGKVLAVKSLNLDPAGVIVVGDGYTDYKIKEAGCADKFCAFCENVRRESVVEKADFEVDRFSEVIENFYA